MKGVTFAWETMVKIILVVIFLVVAAIIILMLFNKINIDLSILNATSFIENIFKL